MFSHRFVELHMEITELGIFEAKEAGKDLEEAGFEGEFIPIGLWRLAGDVGDHRRSQVQNPQSWR